MLGVMAVQSKQNQEKLLKGMAASELVKNRDAISRLAQSGDAQRLMALLQQRGGVQEAAKAAADGDPSQLMTMMNQLMSTREGAELVERIGDQAKKAGLE
ncbi:hypothetical protein [Pseudoflavonifractor phocaeensis]|uniref:hypothetical protein n=1 Tax=Pseudoflavonifractor phocaeensis TaxID=1870988 RepID=UPI001F3CD2E5|nr:hypothetical protein [Pseudoflavonifractor phocaeensis]